MERTCAGIGSRGVLPVVFVALCAASARGQSREIDVADLGTGAAVTVADLNGDGLPDLVVADYVHDRFAWWANLGDHQWGPRRDIGFVNAAFTVRAGDLNGDGRPDLVGASRATDEVFWYENTPTADPATPSFVERLVLRHDDMDPQSLGIADFDGDGDNDLVVAFVYDDRGIVILPNADGTGAMLGQGWQDDPAVVTLTAPDGVEGASAVTPVDFDGDGRIDVVASTAWDWVGTNNHYWFRNTGAGPGRSGAEAFEYVHVAGGPEYNGVFTQAVADIDGDGGLDVVTSTYGLFGNHVVRWHRRLNAEGTAWSVDHVIDDFSGGASGDQSLVAADLDGDGFVDLVSGTHFSPPPPAHERFGPQRAVRAYYNDGAGGFRTVNVAPGFAAHGVDVADLDGDGRPEIIACSWTFGTDKLRYWVLDDGVGGAAASGRP